MLPPALGGLRVSRAAGPGPLRAREYHKEQLAVRFPARQCYYTIPRFKMASAGFDLGMGNGEVGRGQLHISAIPQLHNSTILSGLHRTAREMSGSQLGRWVLGSSGGGHRAAREEREEGGGIIWRRSFQPRWDCKWAVLYAAGSSALASLGLPTSP